MTDNIREEQVPEHVPGYIVVHKVDVKLFPIGEDGHYDGVCVLRVAVTGYGNDWAAYYGAVWHTSYKHYENECIRLVREHGDKCSKDEAMVVFEGNPITELSYRL